MHAGSIPQCDTFFLFFFNAFGKYHYQNVLILYTRVRKYACQRVYKTHNGHAFMISMNGSKICKHVHVPVYSTYLFW